MYVEIPAYEKVYGKNEKHSFTVFQIDIFYKVKQHTVFKRYTEFDRLNTLLIQNKTSVPTFPGKTVRKWNPKTLEYRRQVFENYLNVLLKRSIIPPDVISFLQLGQSCPGSPITVGSMYETPRSFNKIEHSVVAFPHDFRLKHDNEGNMADIILSGVLQGHYDHM